MAGLGRAPTLPDPDRYTRRYAHCDVLIVGGGPAGLAAALAAAEGGAQVLLCDEQAELGGTLLAAGDATIDGKSAQSWLIETIAALARRDNVTLLPRTTAFGYFPHNMLALAERVTGHLADPAPNLPRERLWQVRAKEVVIAAGAIERPLTFPGNDRPGIMLADAARIYAARYAARPGSRAVVVTAHDGAYRAAMELAACGVEIAAVADARARPDGPLQAAALAAGLPIRTATTVTRTRGRQRVSAVELSQLTSGRFWRRIRNDRMRSRPDVRRHDAERAAVLAVARKAALGRHAASLCSGRIGRTGAIGRRVPGNSRPAGRTVRRLRAR